jgi:hypothetical protein
VKACEGGCGKQVHNRQRRCAPCYKASTGHRERIRTWAKAQAKDPAERFWPKVHITDGCWNWTGGTDRYGYGEFRSPVSRKAHRFSFWLINGYLPSYEDGRELDHICTNTLCVRPDHLRDIESIANTLASNNPMAVQARATHCPKCGTLYTVRAWDGHRQCKRCAANRAKARRKKENA